MFEIAGKLVKTGYAARVMAKMFLVTFLLVIVVGQIVKIPTPLPHHENCLGTSLGVSTIDINTFCNKNRK